MAQDSPLKIGRDRFVCGRPIPVQLKEKYTEWKILRFKLDRLQLLTIGDKQYEPV